MVLKAVCPNCKHRGVKEYLATNYDRPRVPGQGHLVEEKRSCPACKHQWFPAWEKMKAAAEAAKAEKKATKPRAKRTPKTKTESAVAIASEILVEA